MKEQIIRRSFDNLRPGGWLECQEIMLVPGCDDDTMADDDGWLEWTSNMIRASDLTNRQIQIGEQLKDWFQEVGFVDVHEALIKVPIGGWPKDLRLKHLGMLWQKNLVGGLSGFSLGLFHRVLGKTVEEIEV